ncbi:MAG: PEP-CTERM sorting domain-containing protein [Phycisphaerae bacterium]|nr:PEP-CTERM sorting domain-containing protein [Phycisphaerae bacterium]MCZ2400167.1 PEP-CTERM sorting domain-containing protein [Phycisphaerae bacterium]
MLRRLLGASTPVGAVAVCVLITSAVSPASASISNVIFKVRAESSLGVAEQEFYFADGAYGPPGTFNWTLANSGGFTDLVDPNNNNIIAALEDASTTIVETPAPGVPYRVRTGFVLIAGAEDTTFTITSALLGFATVDAADAQARTFANITLTDGPGGNGSHLDGLADGGNAVYIGHYNGLAPLGTLFAGLIGGLTISPGGGSASASEAQPPVGFTPLGVAVSSLSNGWKFSVTANDNVSGNGTMLILPEPGTLALVALGLFAALRRR